MLATRDATCHDRFTKGAGSQGPRSRGPERGVLTVLVEDTVTGPSGGPAGARVRLVESDRMNVLGLMLSSMLERRLAGPTGARALHQLRGTVVIDSSGMRAALVFDRQSVAICRTPPEGRVRAQISGALMALLDVALGRRMLRHLLTGRIRARGGPLVLWRILRLLRG